jgi:hypothetical protein
MSQKIYALPWHLTRKGMRMSYVSNSVLAQDPALEQALGEVVALLVPNEATTTEDVAAVLEDAQVRGACQSPWDCPLTRFISGHLRQRGLLEQYRVGVDFHIGSPLEVRVGPLTTEGSPLCQNEFVGALVLPAVLLDFAKAFDGGMYHWLRERPVHLRQLTRDVDIAAAPSSSILPGLFTYTVCGLLVVDDTRLASSIFSTNCEECKRIRLEGKS